MTTESAAAAAREVERAQQLLADPSVADVVARIRRGEFNAPLPPAPIEPLAPGDLLPLPAPTHHSTINRPSFNEKHTDRSPPFGILRCNQRSTTISLPAMNARATDRT